MKLGLLIRSGIILALAGFGLSVQADIGNTLSEAMPEVRAVESAEEYQPHVSLLGGVSTPEGSYDTGGEYGIDVGFQPLIPFVTALELSQANYEADAGADLTRTNLLLKGSYHFGGETIVLKDSYLGLAVGALLEDAGESTDMYGGLMPNLGFDIPTIQVEDDWVTLGANARYLITSSDAPDVFSLNGVVRYLF